mmetsp:Transcript_46180/g.117917  ORF Transcript_46180/g.117917 Transcript_46180/m.117917 type:complete len:276 (+) Transcript_46180:193-1020(+)
MPVQRHGGGLGLPEVERERVVAELQGSDLLLVLLQHLLQPRHLLVLLRQLLHARILNLHRALEDAVVALQLRQLPGQRRLLPFGGLLGALLHLLLKRLQHLGGPQPRVIHVRRGRHLGHHGVYPVVGTARSLLGRLRRGGLSGCHIPLWRLASGLHRHLHLLHIRRAVLASVRILGGAQPQLPQALDRRIDVVAALVQDAADNLFLHLRKQVGQVLQNRGREAPGLAATAKRAAARAADPLGERAGCAAVGPGAVVGVVGLRGPVLEEPLAAADR